MLPNMSSLVLRQAPVAGDWRTRPRVEQPQSGLDELASLVLAKLSPSSDVLMVFTSTSASGEMALVDVVRKPFHDMFRADDPHKEWLWKCCLAHKGKAEIHRVNIKQENPRYMENNNTVDDLMVEGVSKLLQVYRGGNASSDNVMNMVDAHDNHSVNISREQWMRIAANRSYYNFTDPEGAFKIAGLAAAQAKLLTTVIAPTFSTSARTILYKQCIDIANNWYVGPIYTPNFEEEDFEYAGIGKTTTVEHDIVWEAKKIGQDKFFEHISKVAAVTPGEINGVQFVALASDVFLRTIVIPVRAAIVAVYKEAVTRQKQNGGYRPVWPRMVGTPGLVLHVNIDGHSGPELD